MMVFGMTRLGREPATYHVRGGHANHAVYQMYADNLSKVLLMWQPKLGNLVRVLIFSYLCFIMKLTLITKQNVFFVFYHQIYLQLLHVIEYWNDIRKYLKFSLDDTDVSIRCAHKIV